MRVLHGKQHVLDPPSLTACCSSPTSEPGRCGSDTIPTKASMSSTVPYSARSRAASVEPCSPATYRVPCGVRRHAATYIHSIIHTHDPCIHRIVFWLLHGCLTLVVVVVVAFFCDYTTTLHNLFLFKCNETILSHSFDLNSINSTTTTRFKAF